jgi:hypothetical protein
VSRGRSDGADHKIDVTFDFPEPLNIVRACEGVLLGSRILLAPAMVQALLLEARAVAVRVTLHRFQSDLEQHV